MGRRATKAALIATGLALAALATVAVAGRARPAPVPGDVFPIAAGKPGQPVLAWVFRTEDYLTCAAPAAELRRVQVSHPEVAVVAVAVGATQQGWVPAFFRRERVKAELAFLDRSAYRDRFGAARTPAMYLLKDGRIERIFFAGDSESRVAGRLAAIRPALRDALAGRAGTGEAQ